jgi:hypothetical protein
VLQIGTFGHQIALFLLRNESHNQIKAGVPFINRDSIKRLDGRLVAFFLCGTNRTIKSKPFKSFRLLTAIRLCDLLAINGCVTTFQLTLFNARLDAYVLLIPMRLDPTPA